jgi:hypothetical protein
MKGVRYKEFKGKDGIQAAVPYGIVSIDTKNRICPSYIPSNRSAFLVVVRSYQLEALAHDWSCRLSLDPTLADEACACPNVVVKMACVQRTLSVAPPLIVKPLNLVLTDGDKGWLPIALDVPMPIGAPEDRYYNWDCYYNEDYDIHLTGDYTRPTIDAAERRKIDALLGRLRVVTGRGRPPFTLGRNDRRTIRAALIPYVRTFDFS